MRYGVPWLFWIYAYQLFRFAYRRGFWEIFYLNWNDRFISRKSNFQHITKNQEICKKNTDEQTIETWKDLINNLKQLTVAEISHWFHDCDIFLFFSLPLTIHPNWITLSRGRLKHWNNLMFMSVTFGHYKSIQFSLVMLFTIYCRFTAWSIKR